LEWNFKMHKLDYTILGCLFSLLFVIDGLQIIKNRELQTQINELTIIINQKYLPAMILEDINIRE
jgi:hypothetical protein